MLVACSDSRPRKAVNRCQTQGAPLLRERCAKFAQRRFKLRRVDAEIAKPIQQLVAAHHPLAIQHLANCTADNSNDVAAPVGVPWMWTLAFGHHEDRTPTHGCEATREAAMAAFGSRGGASGPLADFDLEALAPVCPKNEGAYCPILRLQNCWPSITLPKKGEV
jgi:hypothetical protein